ncbi:VOC family protein [Terricaulis sp.]|uniref:VOC family protein n=1 Tax=Terricaulis sp. TaxID=2768686 RepID=UPI003784AC23
MAKVLGIGGLFFKARDKDATREWYTRVLGLEREAWGGTVWRPEGMAGQPGAATVFNIMGDDSDYIEPSKAEFMFNLVVDDLDGVLARAKAQGVEPVKLFPDEGQGKFAHILDPDGRKIELWEPKPMPKS